MNMNPLDAFPGVLVATVRAASRICRRVQGELMAADQIEKDDRSPVTVADLAGQALVARRLYESFPHLPLVGEEDSGELRRQPDLLERVASRVRTEWADATEEEILEAIDLGSEEGGPEGRYFTVDPIDGTKGFLRGDQYAVALALVENGQPAIGVLGCPNLDHPDGGNGLVLLAVRGEGTRVLPLDGEGVEGIPCQVSDLEDSEAIRMCESVEAAHTAQGESAEVAKELGIMARPVRIDSQAKYAVLALGGAELYLRIPTNPRRREKIWDHAAGSIVVTEAGGAVTDLDGVGLDFGRGRTLSLNRGIVASNGRVHEKVLHALRGLND
jgi:3'(2'), 5'-bisphosphate nucleotidase